ncbi:hypothetical protein XELAEV_18016784mg [Xenopus laevis]|uniref:Uncharacterized protein n=1 Tax=Xenopus laevis TaxID=8355 RepID=A0A974HS25_XENLA|nr:hypothetical protein XELAEV_18016784mg [Xenopus laevis]
MRSVFALQLPVPSVVIVTVILPSRKFPSLLRFSRPGFLCCCQGLGLLIIRVRSSPSACIYSSRYPPRVGHALMEQLPSIIGCQSSCSHTPSAYHWLPSDMSRTVRTPLLHSHTLCQ